MLNELASDTDNPDLERTGSCSYWRGRFRRKRNPDFSREGRLLAESESGEAGHAGSIRERSYISNKFFPLSVRFSNCGLLKVYLQALSHIADEFLKVTKAYLS